MNTWIVLLIGGLTTFGIRLSFIYLAGRRQIPARMSQALRFVPPAVLSAIIFPELFLRNGYLDFSPANPRLLAGLLAALVAWRTRSIVLTLLLGMAALIGLQYLF